MSGIDDSAISDPAHPPLWAVFTTDDLTEGRSGNYLKHLCKCEATALRLAKGNYVQGANCPVKQIQPRYFGGDFWVSVRNLHVVQPSKADEAEQNRITDYREIREKALAAGLTDDDILRLSGGRA